MKHNYKKTSLFLAVALFLSIGSTFAQSVKLYGVKNTMRYDDGDDTKYTYIGYNYTTGKAEFSGDVGLWSLGVEDNKITSTLVHYDNLLYANSGALYHDGIIYSIMSHEDPDATESDVYEFVVRKWDATTFELLSSKRFPKSANLESSGLTYNPKDGKIYGLFYLTDVPLPVDEEDIPEEDRQDGNDHDAGYALGTLDLETMTMSQITPGIYYENFVTLACSKEGRLYSMTSGGNLVEFDAETGLMTSNVVVNDEGDSEEMPIFKSSGVVSQVKRQAACFDYRTGKMYWNGYVNSGKGYNDWGSYGPLSDKTWRTNGKYDTALYEIDLETGKASKIANIPNRIAFSCLWVDGSEDALTGTNSIKSVDNNTDGKVSIFNTSGQCVFKGNIDDANIGKGIFFIKSGNKVQKVIK